MFGVYAVGRISVEPRYAGCREVGYIGVREAVAVVHEKDRAVFGRVDDKRRSGCGDMDAFGFGRK